jgi:5-hydroxyisourate hydrolase-like protein (transthyretin family)
MKILNIGNESIAFQSGAFFRDVTLIVTDLRAMGASTDSMAKARERITKCIYDHTGIVVRANDIQNSDDAFIMIPAMSRGNVLNHHEYAKRLETYFRPEILRNYDGLYQKGWIDPANSRVGGEFSKFIYNMYIGHDFFFGKEFTAEETAGVIIHEVGHAFTFLQFLADTIIVNNVLLRSYQELTNGKPDKKVKLILSKAADDLEIKNREWIQTVEDDEDGTVAFKVLAAAVQIEPRKMDNKKYFSQFAAEELADIFAARHGAGRAIISMRSKFRMGSRNYNYMRIAAFTVVSMMTALVLPQVGLPLSAFGMMLMMVTVNQHAERAANT